MTYLAPTLQQLGYIGVTGTTPYTASSTSQITTLRNQYSSSLTGQILTRSPTGTIQISLNFDGTQNNREYVAAGEENEGQVRKMRVRSFIIAFQTLTKMRG